MGTRSRPDRISHHRPYLYTVCRVNGTCLASASGTERGRLIQETIKLCGMPGRRRLSQPSVPRLRFLMLPSRMAASTAGPSPEPPFVRRRAGRPSWRRCGGTPFVPTPPPRRGAQRRARGFSGDPAARSSAPSRCGGSWGGTPLPGVSTVSTAGMARHGPRLLGYPGYPRTAATNYREAIGTN